MTEKPRKEYRIEGIDEVKKQNQGKEKKLTTKQGKGRELMKYKINKQKEAE